MTQNLPPTPSGLLPKNRAIAVFLVFALAYFCSALIRAITATLSPTLMAEFSMSPKDLGLLAGAYFLGFSLTQLPLGAWLDRHGPKKVILSFLGIAVLGSVCFAAAGQFTTLWIARLLTGIGVSACLMAPLTAYRRWFDPAYQLRMNSWMLMTGSLGIVASTLPVQWLMPLVGWRPIFVGLGAVLLLAMALIFWVVPRWETQAPVTVVPQAKPPHLLAGYGQVLGHPYFLRHLWVGLFVYGGMVAMQTLWTVPWMIKVVGYTPLQAAQGLFGLNVCMLVAFWAWGLLGPRLARRGIGTEKLIVGGLPLSFVVLAMVIMSPSAPVLQAVPIWLLWAAYCVSCTVVTSAQPAMGLAFPSTLTGRALSAYNLLIFLGVFLVQWGVGLLIDGLKALGWPEVAAYQGAFAIYGGVGVVAYVQFALSKAKPSLMPSR